MNHRPRTCTSVLTFLSRICNLIGIADFFYAENYNQIGLSEIVFWCCAFVKNMTLIRTNHKKEPVLQTEKLCCCMKKSLRDQINERQTENELKILENQRELTNYEMIVELSVNKCVWVYGLIFATPDGFNVVQWRSSDGFV